MMKFNCRKARNHGDDLSSVMSSDFSVGALMTSKESNSISSKIYFLEQVSTMHFSPSAIAFASRTLIDHFLFIYLKPQQIKDPFESYTIQLIPLLPSSFIHEASEFIFQTTWLTRFLGLLCEWGLRYVFAHSVRLILIWMWICSAFALWLVVAILALGVALVSQRLFHRELYLQASNWEGSLILLDSIVKLYMHLTENIPFL